MRVAFSWLFFFLFITNLLLPEASFHKSKDGAFILVDRGNQRIPIQKEPSFMLSYASEAYFIEALGELSRIKGVFNAQYLYSPVVREAVGKKRILDIRTSSYQLPTERILAVHPTYLSVDATALPAEETLEILKNAGITPFQTAYFLEQDPLSKAQWIQFYGMLLGKEAEATQLFESIKVNYLRYKNHIHSDENLKKVILELPYGNTWYVASKHSLMAAFLKDAKGDYIIEEENNNKKEVMASLALSLDYFIASVKKADIWLISSNKKLSKNDILKNFPYLRPLKGHIESMSIYANTKQLLPPSNNAWERGDLRVDEMLRDLIIILHPEAFKEGDRTLRYYEEVH